MEFGHNLVDGGLADAIWSVTKSSPFCCPVRVTNSTADDDSLLGSASEKKGCKETKSVGNT